MSKLALSVLVAGTVVLMTVFCLFAQTASDPLLFTLSTGAAATLVTGGVGSLNIGFAKMLMATGNAAPDGFEIFQFRQNNILVSETTVPASPLVSDKAFFVEIGGSVNTAVAIANPNAQSATISFDYQDPLIRFRGGGVNPGVVTIPPNSQISAFINEPPFKSPAPYFGMMRLVSTIPVAVTSLRGLRNERGEFLMTTIIEPDTTRQRGSNVIAPEAIVGYIPLVADGGGWTTELVLRNPDFDDAASGTLDFLDPNGNPLPLTINGQSTPTLRFFMDRGDFQRFNTGGAGSNIRVGSIRVTADAHSFSPDLFAIYTFKRAGITVSMASAPMVQTCETFDLFVEESGGQLQTGVVINSASPVASSVLLRLTDLKGNQIGNSSTINIPRFGQISKFLKEIPGFAAVPSVFQGVLHISTNTAEAVSVIGVHGRFNERSDFVITTVQPFGEIEETQPMFELFFPHVVDGGGYRTGFVLFNGNGVSSTGMISSFSRNGPAFKISVN